MADARGSEKWLRESFKTPVVRLQPEHLKAFIDLAKVDGVELLDWLTHGTPKPDVFRGTLRVTPDAARDVFERLISLETWVTHEWFPIGIPFPDVYHVNVKNLRGLPH